MLLQPHKIEDGMGVLSLLQTVDINGKGTLL